MEETNTNVILDSDNEMQDEHFDGNSRLEGVDNPSSSGGLIQQVNSDIMGNLDNNISKEELDVVTNLVGSFFKINKGYGVDIPLYDKMILSSSFKGIDNVALNKYLGSLKIKSHLEFQLYVLQLCSKYCDHLQMLMKTHKIIVNSDAFKYAYLCLDQYERMLLNNTELRDKYSKLKQFVWHKFKAINDYGNHGRKNSFK